MRRPEKPPVSFANLGRVVYDIIDNKEVLSKLNQIEKDYPYWEEFRNRVKDISIEPDTLWKYIINFPRSFAITNIKLDDLPSYKFKYNITPDILKRLHKFDISLGGLFEGSSLIAPGDRNKFLVSSLMDEAIASAQLDGAILPYEEAKEMLLTERKPRDNSEAMAVGNFHAMKRVIELKEMQMSPELILELYGILIQHDPKRSKTALGFRDTDDMKIGDINTGDIYYTVPGFEIVEKAINEICHFANNNETEEFIHPIIKAAIIHYLILYTCPFNEANNRLARVVFYWYLVTHRYWLVEYLSISKAIQKAEENYMRQYLYSNYDDNDLTYFIKYYLKTLQTALEGLKDHIKLKMDEKNKLYHLFRSENINERQADIIKELISDSHKTFTIKEVENKYGTVYQTARTDLLYLVKEGYLEQKETGKKMVFFRSANFE